jgi:uncharacterized protein with PIN domain
MIDACLSIHLAKYLREKGLSVRHVSEINPRLSDTHIKYMMLQTDVLLTRDRDFYKQLGNRRAIYCAINTNRRRKRFSWYMMLKQALAYEHANGISDYKVESGMNAFFA